MDTKDKQTIDEYRATHPECRWCIHNILASKGRSTCRVKDVEFKKNNGFVGKVRARFCPCYSIK